MAGEFTKPTKIIPAVLGTIADPDAYNQNIGGQSNGSILPIDDDGNFVDGDIGDETKGTNGAIVNDLKVRDTSTVKIYDSSSIQQDSALLGQATEEGKGFSEIATQDETDAGIDDKRYITPLKLNNFPGLDDNFSGFIGKSSFTSSGTWTKPVGCSKVIVEVIASGGGGGAGGDSTAGLGASASGGGGGGAGGYSLKTITDIGGLGASESVSIGAGGAGGIGGGNAPGNDGSSGGISSFGLHMSATGGAGGIGGGNASVSPSSPGGVGGIGIGGNSIVSGGDGGSSGQASGGLDGNNGNNSGNTTPNSPGLVGSGGVGGIGNGTTEGGGGGGGAINQVFGGTQFQIGTGGQGGLAANPGSSGADYGSGGGGGGGESGTVTNINGAAGKSGLVVIYEYQ